MSKMSGEKNVITIINLVEKNSRRKWNKLSQMTLFGDFSQE